MSRTLHPLGVNARLAHLGKADGRGMEGGTTDGSEEGDRHKGGCHGAQIFEACLAALFQPDQRSAEGRRNVRVEICGEYAACSLDVIGGTLVVERPVIRRPRRKPADRSPGGGAWPLIAGQREAVFNAEGDGGRCGFQSRKRHGFIHSQALQGALHAASLGCVMEGEMRIAAIVIAVLMLPLEARAAGADNAGMAAAYLQHCPEFRAGPRLIAEAESLIRDQGGAMDAFTTAMAVAKAEIRTQPVAQVCQEAAELFGAKGRVERSFLLDKRDSGLAVYDIAAAGSVALPGEEHDALAVTSAFVVVALRECPQLTFSNGFAYFLEKQGYSPDDLTGQGRLTVDVTRSAAQIYRWAEWRRIVMTGEPMAEFCRIALERYGPSGTVTVDMVKRK